MGSEKSIFLMANTFFKAAHAHTREDWRGASLCNVQSAQLIILGFRATSRAGYVGESSFGLRRSVSFFVGKYNCTGKANLSGVSRANSR